MNIKKNLVFVFLTVPFFSDAQQQWQPKQAVLMTEFAKDVNPENVLPEYPRPQLVREKWMNLNGLWQYQPAIDKNETLPKGSLSSAILVPFSVESALSGIMEHHETIWYKRSFTVPSNWKKQRVLLHFGAVDYQADVFVNGKKVGSHTGGYDPFSFDVTSALNKKGKQEIAVKVYDPTDKGGFPRGKQSLYPQGIMYTSVTGIWQTVWLEPVAQAHVDNIKIVPDVDKSELRLTVNSADKSDNLIAEITVKDGANVVQRFSGKANTELLIPIKDAKLWSPTDPFLYDLEIVLKDRNKIADVVSSYFGMRKIAIGEEDGFKKMFLNNKFVFQMGPLDQGFWPDGIYTAPTDEALRYDLEMIKKLGFNMVRKHIKVEPQRWYYWADKLGIMVWQDMPSANSYTEHPVKLDEEAFSSELEKMIETHWNSPSIISWVVFNEGQGQHNTPELVSKVKNLDPSRLVNQGSGWSHFGVGDVLDVHSYPPPSVGNSKTQTLACGEYGGIGYIIPGHTWKIGPTYVMIDNDEEYNNLYDSFSTDLTLFKTNQGLSAAVYTEITDVEIELNGLITYDRKVVKGDINKITAANKRAINDNIYLTTLLPTSEKEAREWEYTFKNPGNNWMKNQFSDISWNKGLGGFGTKGTPGAIIKTEWKTDDIWLRQEFTLGDLSDINLDDVKLYIHHDDDCEVYINGVKAVAISNYTGNYSLVEISKESKEALKANGTNLIAIHCKQRVGGQFIDAGLSILTKK
jgi:hypothetical protein